MRKGGPGRVRRTCCLNQMSIRIRTQRPTDDVGKLSTLVGRPSLVAMSPVLVLVPVPVVVSAPMPVRRRFRCHCLCECLCKDFGRGLIKRGSESGKRMAMEAAVGATVRSR